MSDTIKIKTIRDIYDKVPEDRWEACTKDLYQWLLMHKTTEKLNDIMKACLPTVDDVDVVSHRDSDVMNWVDDGNVGISKIEVEVKEGK